MRKYNLFLSLMVFFCSTIVLAQSPYSISPNWAFGKLGRFNFPNGNFPVAGAPTQANTPLNQSCESSTSMSFKNNTMAVYTNARRCNNGANTLIRDFETDNTCASSATSGGVSFPDPARNNYPTGNISNDGFYIVLGNDMTGGACSNRGLNQHRFSGTGTGVAHAAGPVNILANDGTAPSEALVTATDGVGGYWLITHTKTAANTFKVWHYTATGRTGPIDYNVGVAFNSDNAGSQSYLKVSPCQDKIAFIGGNTISIVGFNRTTGVISGELLRIGSTTSGPGLEFSPSGNRIFYNGISQAVNWRDIGAPNNSGTVASSISWSMQLGPDGRLYTSGAGYDNGTIGVIANPDAATPTVSTIALTGGALIHNGFINQSWLSPESPFVNPPTGSGCSRTVSFDFENYFNTDIPVNVSSVVWNFGDGTGNLSGLGLTPTHTFPSNASSVNYTITVTFQDQYCGHTWTANRVEAVLCPAPVTLLNFSGAVRNDGILLSWQTTMELNNEYFDVQRSLDGVNFESIEHKRGAGNSTRLLSYSHLDPYDGAGTVYYRLVQHDFDGKTAASNIIALQLGKGLSIPVSVAPNPFSESMVLTKLVDEKATVIVYDILGRILEQIHSPAEEQVIYVGSTLAKGTYLVQYATSESSYTIRVEKQ